MGKYITASCPFCGHEMHWNADYNADEFGYFEEGDENRIVTVYTCPNCGCEGTFISGKEEE